MRHCIAIVLLFLLAAPAAAQGPDDLPPLPLDEMSIDSDGVLTGYVTNPFEETITNLVLTFRGRDPGTQTLKITKTLRVGALAPQQRKKITADLGTDAGLLEFEVEYEYEYPLPEISDVLTTAVDAQVERTSEGFEINGNGPALTDELAITAGLTTFRFNFRGEGDFAVHLLDLEGNPVETLVERQGPYRGYVNRTLEGGKYTLDVAAEGDWTVTVVVKGGSAPTTPSGPLEMDTGEDGVITITN